MTEFAEEQKIHRKILYWGMAGSGKTTIVDTLYKLTKEQEKIKEHSITIEPIGDLNKIASASGATLYFDRGVFKSKKQKQLYYHIFTVAGQNRFFPLREKIFKGTEGVIFVIDSQTNFFEDNIESLKELKSITKGKLIQEIPLIIMLNKQDLTDVIGEDDIIQVLKNEKLWYDTDNKLHVWNPIIYKTCALYNQQKDVYRSFSECARRTGIYKIYGNGNAPIDKDFSKLSINDDI